ncbi:phage tail tape measure protein [Solibacillus sp. FSL H8-0538]|uniref:phage tail tape measure protein n=1 Tax=Solibacillus sp. FSL H8-0538 TaxID=2921400 RepID=UPI0030F99CC8
MTSLGSLEVSLSLNAANFNKTIAQVDRHLKSMGSELQAIRAKGAAYENSIDGMRQKQDVLNRSFDASSLKLQEQRKRYDEMKASGTATETQLERQANLVNRAQTEYNRLERELSEVTEELRIQSSQWTQVGQRMEAVGATLKSVGDKMSSIGKDLSMKVTAPIIALGAASFKAAVDFESAFAGVRKTVDTTEEGFAKLEQGIRDMAKAGPSSASELAEIMEMAGQLGIAEDSLLSFTSTVSDLTTATNMTADQAATEFARFANIVGMSQDDFDKMGSSIVELGNNFATTESEISAMAMRLAGAGAQIGLSEADILGLSAALTSVGIEAEMGGSAISKVMVNMQVASTAGFKGVQELTQKTGLSLREMQLMSSNNSKGFTLMAESLGMTKTELNNMIKAGANLDGFSKIAGMTSEQFVKAFETDAIGALGAFINGLGNAEEAGESAINMLQEMGITEVRLRDSLLRAGNANELFAEAIKMSNDAWEENSALTDEASKRYATTESQLLTMKNRMMEIAMTIGEILIPIVLDIVNKVADWVEKFSDMSERSQKLALVIGAIAAAIGPLLIIGGALISSFGTIIGAVGTLSTAIGTAGGVTALLTAKLGFLSPVLTALSGPLGWTVAGIAAIGTAAVVVGKQMGESAIQIEDWSVGVSEATANAVGGFVKISDDVGQTLSTLYLTSTKITDEIATDLTSKFDAMYSQIVESSNEKHNAQMESLQNYFLNSSALTSNEEAKILEKRQQAHDAEIERLTAKNQLVADITQKAIEENRQLTYQERVVINNINLQMKEDAVRVLSESEVEQKVILEKMRVDASEVTALQAAEVVKNAVDQKQKVIEEANKQYEESIAHITRLRDETSEITTEQADRMIAEAKKSRDQTIFYAEEMHDEIVSEAKLQAGEHVDQVDWETGEIKSKWEVMKTDVSNKLKELGTNIKRDWTQAYNDTSKLVKEMASSVNEKFQGMGKNVGIKMNEAKDKIVGKWNEAEAFLKGINLKQIGLDIVSGLIKGIGDKFDGVQKKVEELASLIPEWTKKILGIKSPSRVMMAVGNDIGDGLVIGIGDKEPLIQKKMESISSIITNVTKNNAAEVAKIADKAEADRTKIQETYATKRKNLKKFTSSQIQGLEKDMHDKLDAVNTKAWADMQKKESEVSSQKLAAIKQYLEDKKSTEQLSLVAEAQIWEQSMLMFDKGTKERVEAQKTYKTAVEAVNKELISINNDYSNQIQKVNEDLVKQEETLTKAYEDAVNKRATSLYSFKNLFDEFKVEIDTTGDQLLVNLGTQVEGFKAWQREIETLSEKAIDKGLLAELREMGPNALPQLIALNSMTDTQLTQYSNLYKEKSALARKQAEIEMVGMKNDTDKQIKSLRTAAASELDRLQIEWSGKIESLTQTTATELSSLKQIGVDAGNGLLQGLSSTQGALQRKAQEIAESISKTIANALKIKSPSRVTMGFGVNINEGLIKGMEQSHGRLQEAMNNAYGSLSSSAAKSAEIRTASTMSSTSTIDNSRYMQPSITIINQVPNTSPSEIARKALQTQRQFAMEWGV